MLTHEPNLRSNSPTNMADPRTYCDHPASVWGQLILLLILTLVALMRWLR
jgi:hypothetical protein